MSNEWPRWACVYTAPRQEVQAKWGIDALGYDCFLPMAKVRDRKKGGTWNYRPLFPRYLFARIPHPWCQFSTVRGVEAMLCQDEIPICVPDAAIEAVRRSIDMGLFDERTPKSLSVGDRVKLLKGPFAEHIAEIVKVRRNSVRILWVLFGSTRQVDVPLAFVEAA